MRHARRHARVRRRHADRDDHELRIVLLLAQPDDAHAVVDAVVHDVQADEALVEVDGALDIANEQRNVSEVGGHGGWTTAKRET